MENHSSTCDTCAQASACALVLYTTGGTKPALFWVLRQRFLGFQGMLIQIDEIVPGQECGGKWKGDGECKLSSRVCCQSLSQFIVSLSREAADLDGLQV